MYNALSKLAEAIARLLSKNHDPLVEVRTSSVADVAAGRGVFATTRLEQDVAVALYPGVYTPPLPRHLSAIPSSSSSSSLDDTTAVYLGNRTSPSGLAVEENAYLLSLQAAGGGYLDGLALERSCFDGFGGEGSSTTTPSPPAPSMDSNPSACGQLINHSSVETNVEVETFLWHEMINLAAETKKHHGSGDDDNEGSGDEENDNATYPLPNERRQDGTPWYHDGEALIRFDRTSAALPFSNVGGAIGGAALVTSRVVEQGEELFLNYKLQKPYPAWAETWYQ